MKTLAPRELHGAQLRELMRDLGADVRDVARLMRSSERTVFRWLADDAAPWPVLAVLWHESAIGRGAAAQAVDAERAMYYQRAETLAKALEATRRQLLHLAAIAETGAANDAIALPAGLSLARAFGGVQLALPLGALPASRPRESGGVLYQRGAY